MLRQRGPLPFLRMALRPRRHPPARASRSAPRTVLRTSASAAAPTAAAQAPLRLTSAGFSGVDLPDLPCIVNGLSDPPGGPWVSHPTQVPCGIVRGSHVPHFQGLSGTNGPLRPLETVGPSVYRFDMRETSSSGPLATPPVHHRHAKDMRRFRDRYTRDMRRSGYRHATGMRRVTGNPPFLWPSRSADHGIFRPAAGRFPPSTRGAHMPVPVEDSLQIGAAGMPGIAPNGRLRRRASTVRHRNCLLTNNATPPSPRADAVST